ncbi:glycosyltransferase family 4 protein [Sphingobacterium sp. SRCM116780]|uniref:glycosyltransferase family 4 protein n=1 Tax=Sphingobacterium sp. SRCM116780 TaxID=2907623 RepID=UPI001F3E269F|nr:glycosyltransferase family 4 protein [Sphingobacterium sp. SRCM116780]UIR57451.1 glycosyltransferase family 4 protein [Sphingobacterium sp. SRCM116780]
MKIAIIGTYPPRKCGIATFTQDLYKSLIILSDEKHGIFSISDGCEETVPTEVSFIIDKDDVNSYHHAAQLINQNYNACLIQHEYGIFGGETGCYIIDLLQKLTVPVATNLHTILQNPSINENKILCQLAQYSDKITVMTPYAIQMLKEIYQIEEEKITFIPHGVPEFTYNQKIAKERLGLQDKKIMLSFGFVGRNKGFETALEAIANVEEEDFVYIILGTTHPNILKEEGEFYRLSLIDKAKKLAIDHKIQFINSFASEELLIKYLNACDIYVTPYPNENQISSGTLSFAIGAGAAVISTPYWYAKDLLAEERGLLFPFKDAKALSLIINQLLKDPDLLKRYRSNAANYGAQISWLNIGKLQLNLIESLQQDRAVSTPSSYITKQNKLVAPMFPTSNHHRLSS